MSRPRFAASGGIRIAYEFRASAYTRRPVLVLIQGLGFDRAGWGPAVRQLRRSFRLVLIDNRGSGDSTPASRGISVADMCGDVVAVLDDIGTDAAHVMGASLGGMVAQDLAIRHPDRVDRLVLACTTPGWPFAYPMPAAYVRLLGSTKRLEKEDRSRRLIEGCLSAATVAERPELVDRILACQRSASGENLGAWHAQAAAGARYAGQLRQRRIRARTLILHGAADQVVDPRNARLLADRIAASELVTFPGLGHLFFWEDPDGFAAAVTDFLLERDARTGVALPPAPSRSGRSPLAIGPGWQGLSACSHGEAASVA